MSFFGFMGFFWFVEVFFFVWGGLVFLLCFVWVFLFVGLLVFLICFAGGGFEDPVRKQLKCPVLPRNNFPAWDLFPHFTCFLAQTTSHREALIFILHNYCGIN